MIWQVTEDALDGLGVPMAANQMILPSGSQLPDVFLVYRLITAPPLVHADDFETMRLYVMQVSIYSRSGLSGMPNVSGAMVDAGFTRGPMRELPYNPETRHFGLAMDFNITSDEEELESY